MLLRQTAVYMSANVVSAAMGFVSAMVFTRLFTPEDYGISVVAGSVGAILSAVLYTWVRLSVLRFQAAGDEADMRTTALVGYGAASLLLLAVVPGLALVAHLSWQQAIGAGLFALTIALFEMQLEMLRARQAVRRYALGVCLRAVVFLALGVAFYAFGLGGFGLVLALALAYLVASAVLAPAAWAPPLRAFDSAVARQMLIFGLPATISGLTLSLHAASDRLVVAWMLGDSVGGQYGVAADFTRQIILVPAMALGSAVVPAAVRAFSAQGREAAREHLAEAGEIMLALLMPAVAGLALVSHEIAAIVMGPSFRDTAALLIPVLCFVWLFQAMSQNYVHVSFHLAVRSKGMMVQGFLSLIVNLALTVPLTWRFGIEGTAVAIVLAEAIGFCIGFAMARTAFPLPFPWRRWLRVVVATGVMALAVLAVGTLVPAASLLVLPAKIATGVLVYGLGVLAFDVGGARRRLVPRRAALA